MLFASIFLWAFLGASFILCTAFLEEYSRDPQQVGRFVFGTSILASIAVSSVMTVVARRFAVSRMLAGMTAGPYSASGLVNMFESLCGRMGVRGADLREAMVGNAFSVGLGGRRVVAVSPQMVQSLSAEEAEAVLAHELSHIKNRDSLAKSLARLAHLAFPFDPVVRLIEAAIYRERELLADRVSVRYTGKPLALASALIKVHSGPVSFVRGLSAGLFIGGSRRGLFSMYPDLQRRIELLLDMADRMKGLQELRTAPGAIA